MSSNNTKDAQIAALKAEIRALKANQEHLDRTIDRMRHEKGIEKSELAEIDLNDQKVLEGLMHTVETIREENKCLKEALDRQRVSATKCNELEHVKAGYVEQYIKEELKSHLSIVNDKKLLEEYKEARDNTKKQLELLQKKKKKFNKNKISVLEVDLAHQKHKIIDLEKKIRKADQENKRYIKWANIKTLLEAKFVLESMFNMLFEKEFKTTASAALLGSCDGSEACSQQEKLDQTDNKTASVALLGSGDGSEACSQQEKLAQADNKTASVALLGSGDGSEACSQQEKLAQADNTTASAAPLGSVDRSEACSQQKLAQPDIAPRRRARLRTNSNKPEDILPCGSSSGCRPKIVNCTCRGTCSTKKCSCLKLSRSCGHDCRCQPDKCTNHRAC